MSHINPYQDKLNCLGAALLTAAAAHALLCLGSIPSLISGPTPEGFLGITLKAAGLVWTCLGAVAGLFVAFQALGIFNGRDLKKARLAAFGTLALPLIGLTGGVTAFALIPVGGAALLLIRNWEAGFQPAAAAYEQDAVEVSFASSQQHDLAA